ncbi:MAG: enoyl-CoA hydratase [Pseudomonadota bacterium]
MSAPPVLQSRAGDVVTLTLNRPDQFNALSEEMLAALQAALDGLAGDEALRCLVIAGAGRAFCAGHDLRQMRGRTDQAWCERLFADCAAVMLAIARFPVPVIARVHGVATAAGCQLVAACDLAVAGEAARFAVSGINVGLFCSTPAVPLSRAIGPKAALDMLFTGRFLTAAEALASGLVSRVAPDAGLDAAVDALAAGIAGKSPVAVRAGKAMFARQAALPLEEAYAFAGEVMARNMMAADVAEGIDAFLEKREPVWKGR